MAAMRWRGAEEGGSVRGGGGAAQRGEVQTARATVRQKKVWAKQAWRMDTGLGSFSRTVSPPNRPCSTTRPAAPQAARRTQARGSFQEKARARTTVRKP